MRIIRKSTKTKKPCVARLFCDRARIRTWDLLIRSELLYPAELRNLRFYFVGVAGFEPAASCSQSRRDNRATLHPENKKAERQGLEPWRRLPVDRLAICSVTTPAPLLLLYKNLSFLRLQMYTFILNYTTISIVFLNIFFAFFKKHLQSTL